MAEKGSIGSALSWFLCWWWVFSGKEIQYEIKNIWPVAFVTILGAIGARCGDSTGECHEVYPPKLVSTPHLELSLDQGFSTPLLSMLYTPKQLKSKPLWGLYWWLPPMSSTLAKIEYPPPGGYTSAVLLLCSNREHQTNYGCLLRENEVSPAVCFHTFKRESRH
jgi:hypothetical protein